MRPGAFLTLALLGCESPPAVVPADASDVVALDVVDVTSPPDVAWRDVVSQGDGCDVQGTCNADFPCGNRRLYCRGETEWGRLRTYDCHFRCGCAPCTGMSCEPDGPTMTCPSGTVCRVSPSVNPPMPDTRETPCEAPDAGL